VHYGTNGGCNTTHTLIGNSSYIFVVKKEENIFVLRFAFEYIEYMFFASLLNTSFLRGMKLTKTGHDESYNLVNDVVYSFSD